MYFGNVKKRLSYSIHVEDMGDIPQPLSAEDLIYFVNQLRAGSEEAREKIILSHLRLSIQIASPYIKHYPDKQDDILQAAYMGIVIAVDRAPKKLYNDNISGYITTTVHSSIAEFLRKDHLVYGATCIPCTTKVAVKEDEDNSEYNNDAEALLFPPQYDDEALVVADFVNRLSPNLRRVCLLRLEGYTDIEIATRFDVSSETIRELRGKVGQAIVRWRGRNGFGRKDSRRKRQEGHGSEREFESQVVGTVHPGSHRGKDFGAD